MGCFLHSAYYSSTEHVRRVQCLDAAFRYDTGAFMRHKWIFVGSPLVNDSTCPCGYAATAALQSAGVEAPTPMLRYTPAEADVQHWSLYHPPRASACAHARNHSELTRVPPPLSWQHYGMALLRCRHTRGPLFPSECTGRAPAWRALNFAPVRTVCLITLLQFV